MKKGKVKEQVKEAKKNGQKEWEMKKKEITYSRL
jgi:hypothetical protein